MNLNNFIKSLLLIMAVLIMLSLFSCTPAPNGDGVDDNETGKNNVGSATDNPANGDDPDGVDEIIVLPDGKKMPKSKLQILEDGTVVTAAVYENNIAITHRSYLPDGTIAVSDYYSADGKPCRYEDAANMFIKFYNVKNLLLKSHYYRVDNMLLLQEEIFEYSTETPVEDKDFVPSASTLLIYNEENGAYEKSKKEYNLLFGKNHPDKEMIFDTDGNVASHILYEYSDSGVLQKKECFTNNNRTELVTYDAEGLPSAQSLFNTDGSVFFEKKYEKGVMASEKYINTDGSNYTIFYENDIPILKEAVLSDGSTETTEYDENGLEKLTVRKKASGAVLSRSVYEHYKYTGKNTVTTYDPYGLLLKSVEYYGTGEKFEGYISYNFHHNGVVSELKEYNENNEMVRQCFYDTSGKQIGGTGF